MSLINSVLNGIIKPFKMVKAFVVRVLDVREIDVEEIIISQVIANINHRVNNRSLTLKQLRAAEGIVCFLNISAEIDDIVFESVTNVAKFITIDRSNKEDDGR